MTTIDMPWTLELVAVPVRDVERAAAFYRDQLGFVVDHDTAIGDGARMVQLTPPGSGCSIVIGDGVADGMPAGSLTGLQLVVSDVARARAELIGRGVDVSDIRVLGQSPTATPHPLDNVGFCFFDDPDGNSWAIQQISNRGPAPTDDPAPVEPAFAPATTEVVATRVLEAPVERVWRAWSDPGDVARWWGPAGFTVPIADVDFREGGRSLLCMRAPQGGDLYNAWHYHRIVAHERIEFVLTFTDDAGATIDPQSVGIPPGVPREVPHTITFEALDASTTQLTVTERGYTTTDAAEMSKLGLDQVLDKLAALVAGGGE